VSASAEPVFAGARAAGLLEEACRSGRAISLQLEVVRDLALDIRRQLGALASLAGLAGEGAAPDILAEAALRCADLATLAACSVAELPPEERARAIEAARLAAGAVRDLRSPVEACGEQEGEHASNLLRDVKSAAWRAEFAARLVDEEASS
jgi:hypothetical protein